MPGIAKLQAMPVKKLHASTAWGGSTVARHVLVCAGQRVVFGSEAAAACRQDGSVPLKKLHASTA